MSRVHSRRQEPHKVQYAVPKLQEQRALQEASVMMISDYCKMEGEELLETAEGKLYESFEKS